MGVMKISASFPSMGWTPLVGHQTSEGRYKENEVVHVSASRRVLAHGFLK